MDHQHRRNKVFVLGLDGATFDLLLPWAERGFLPNISKVMEGGTRGELESTFPPVTAPAWTSFATGMNPGNHGVFDFRKPLRNRPDRAILSSREIRCKKIWNYLSENEKTSVVVNVPLTYPPEAVKGAMISGMLTPEVSENMITPSSLYPTLMKAIGEYCIDIIHEKNWHLMPLDRFLERLDHIGMTKERATRFLMSEVDWDFFMVVLEDMDRIQHRFWKIIDPEAPRTDSGENSREFRLLLDYYRKLDERVGVLLSGLDESTTVVLLSDHGFGTLENYFYVNEWLASIGLFKEKQRIRLKSFVRKLDVFNLRKFRRQNTFAPTFDRSASVNWSESKAYSGSNTENGIYINVRGREPNGIVEMGEEYDALRRIIADRLSDLRNPDSGERLIEAVYMKEELYEGRSTDSAPDLIFRMCDESYAPKDNLGQERGILSPLPLDDPAGQHRSNGILVVKGNNVRKGERIDGATILDIAPTILHLMDQEVPEAMDGRVLTELFSEGFVSEERKIRFSKQDASRSQSDGPEVFSDGENEAIVDRLRGLGYID